MLDSGKRRVNRLRITESPSGGKCPGRSTRVLGISWKVSFIVSDLASTLRIVRDRIDKYGPKGINEQDTKGSLIQPVLRALGWDVEDLEDVQREYRRKSSDKPVDYALMLIRTPSLFCEAKALGQNLDDRKWANQIMGYASVAGVEWVVLTDGNEYRLYNSHATVPIEEKLFRMARISDDVEKAESMLSLLSKDRIRENEISVLWKAHYVDRQVQAAVATMFGDETDSSLVRLIVKRVGRLTAGEVRASLRRAEVTFDFPVKSIGDLAASDEKVRPRKRRSVGPKEKRRDASRSDPGS
jgi:hypothetical protein